MKTLVLLPENKTEITISYMAAPGATLPVKEYFTPEHLITAICQSQHVSVEEFLSKKRTRPLPLLRKIAAKIIFDNYFTRNLHELSHYLGKDDHSLMCDYLEKMNGYLEVGDKSIVPVYESCMDAVMESLLYNRIHHTEKMRLVK